VIFGLASFPIGDGEDISGNHGSWSMKARGTEEADSRGTIVPRVEEAPHGKGMTFQEVRQARNESRHQIAIPPFQEPKAFIES
jgi:hypothetical protein